MSEEYTVAGTSKVRYVGVFDLGEVYKLLYDLLTAENYTVEEEKYKEKITNAGKQIEINWVAEKKVDDYTMFVIKISYFIVGLEKVKVKRDGVEVSMNKGDIEIAFKAILKTDYENRWETSPILKFLKGIYDVYIYKSTFENWKKQIYNEMYSIQNEIKSHFNLSRFL